MTRARDTRTYITVHDGMPEHPKIEGLSDGAFRTLVEAWCWCSRNQTDGHIPEASWKKRGTPANRKELLSGGMVETTPTGVYMHDYTLHQRTADEIAEQRRKNIENGRKGGQAKAANRSLGGKPASETLANG